MTMNHLHKPLNKKFYSLPTLDVARFLLGKYLIRNLNGTELSGMIVETEAYHEKGDPSCHAYSGRTERNSVMFGPPGHLYVYFTYGMHYCMNVVTEKQDTAAAVLIRAVQPVSGIERMKSLRGGKFTVENFCNGPAKLCQAFSVDKNLNGISLLEDTIYISEGENIPDTMVQKSTRVGISKGIDLPWRFFIRENKYVSKKV